MQPTSWPKVIVAKDLNGNFYVSSWSGGSNITRFGNGFTTQVNVVTSGLSNPADIFYNPVTDTLAVPNSGSGNNTAYYFFGSSSGLEEHAANYLWFQVSTANDELNVRFNVINTESVELSLVNMAGKSVCVERINPISGFNEYRIDLNYLNPGMYVIRLQQGRLRVSKNFIWIQP